ncbi:MAG: PSD1 and planctomycete cytochrome C domain-containing protein [Planctomycetota bacterium]
MPKPATSVNAAVVLLFCGLSFFCAKPVSAQTIERELSFNRDIRPILSDKCFHCHGPDEETRAVDLRFDVQDSALDVIEPGDAEASEMIERILDEDPDWQMPPPEAHKPLEAEEIELLKAWIDQGAVWDEFWAYVPPEKHPVETPSDREWAVNWIDDMVLARMEANGFAPSKDAENRVLVRRLYLDLIGLPPTPEQVEAFINDDSGQAYERLVDDLLGSEHFGERLAMYWLDLVRFADTVGYHGDQDHNVSPYRDWVITSFNNNLPFDQFTREQLAGDLLESPTEQQIIATAYNRLLQTTHEGGLQPAEYRAIYQADRVRNVSAVWMGATLGCAQCHDHKYDPYTMKDFYSMAAFFADIDDERHFKDGTNALPTRRSPELLVIDDEGQRLLDEAHQRRQLTIEMRNELRGRKAEYEESEESLAGFEAELKRLDDAIRTHDSEIKIAESRGAWVMITQALEEPRSVRVLPRGNWLDENGEVVQPAYPEFMTSPDSTDPRLTRLDLATWLTDVENGSGTLTARVFANRIWYLFMGVGLSKSLDDFGGQGEAPAFPELLDNLALEFSGDWDVKNLIKTIVMSRSYRQSSVASEELLRVDPYNQMFARQSRYRLPAETVRDVSLSISGLLNLSEVGGKSVKPYQPAGYYRHLNFPTRRYSHTTDEGQWRRGIYVHWQRMFLHPSLRALDAPSREECTCERARSNTPLAALALLNDPCFVEAARAFAERIITEADSDEFETRARFAFEWCTSRPPGDREIAVLKELYQLSLAEFAANEPAARELLDIGLSEPPDGIAVVELAAWTNVARAVLNMSETISRN